jgi:hypothetical protein
MTTLHITNANSLSLHDMTRFNFKITTLYLGIRCNTLHNILLKLQTTPLTFQEMNKEIIRCVRIIDITLYGVKLSKNDYTAFSYDTIIKELESAKTFFICEYFAEAQQCINKIQVEKNNLF